MYKTPSQKTEHHKALEPETIFDLKKALECENGKVLFQLRMGTQNSNFTETRNLEKIIKDSVHDQFFKKS